MHVLRTLVVFAAAVATATSTVAGDAAQDALCNSYVSPVNSEAGVGAYDDPNCLDEPSAVGCFDKACRFCRVETTIHSQFFKWCNREKQAMEDTPKPKQESAVACTVSPGDQASGLSAFYDETCPGGNGGGIGCQQDKCRFCKASTSNTTPYLACPSAGAAPPVTTAPLIVTPGSESDGCASAVATSGLAAVSYVTEAQCNTASPRFTGCVANTKCQLCRTGKNEGNQYLISCKVLQDSKKSEAALAFSATESFALNTNFAGVMTEQQTSSEGGDSTVWVASSVAGVGAAVLAIVAIWKVKKTQRAPDFRGPCTPMNGALMSLDTCVSNL